MPEYRYIVRDEENNRLEGKLNAPGPEAAMELLRKQNYTVVSIVEARKKVSSPLLDELNLFFQRMKHRVPLKVLVFFTRQLSTMYSAGLTLEKSIKNLAAEEKHPRFKKVVEKIASDLEKGSSLSDAFARQPGVFSNLYVALVKAGEVSGSLHTVLGQLADYLEAIQDTRRKVISALLYPALILVFLSVVLTFIFMVIIPMFSNVYVKLGASLPGPTLMLVMISNLFRNHFPLLLLTLFFLVLTFWILSMTQRGGYLFDVLKLKIPIFGGLIHDSIMNKFSKTLGILLASGVPVMESMNLMEKVVGNRVFEQAIREASEYIRDGFTISNALEKTGHFPSTLLQLASTGEETGEIDQLLEKAADFYGKQVDALVSRLTSVIEPILIVFVGVVVGGILIMTYLPVFYLGAALQRGM